MSFGVEEDDSIGKRVHEGEVSHAEEDMVIRLWSENC